MGDVMGITGNNYAGDKCHGGRVDAMPDNLKTKLVLCPPNMQDNADFDRAFYEHASKATGETTPRNIRGGDDQDDRV